jgi:diguanylate cyclase (GGDEF)-like protein/PAS domain S-box-containing protein
MRATEGALVVGLGVACLIAFLAVRRARASERRQRLLFDHLPQTAVAVFDHDLRVRFAAGPAISQAGATASEIEGRELTELLPQAQVAALIPHYRAALRGEKRSFEYRVPQSGRDYWVRIVPMAAADGEVIGGLALALDLSDRQQLERPRSGATAGLDAVTDATRALARSVDPDSARTAICEAVSQVADAPVVAMFEPGPGGLVLTPTAAVGADLGGLELPLDGGSGLALAFGRAEEIFTRVGERAADADRGFLRRARADAVLWHPVIRDRAAIGVLAIAWRGDIAGVSLRLSTLIELLGAEAAVAIGRADLLGQLEHMARTDDLTGLPNRRHWEEELPRELARGARERTPLCVAMLDLDHFKAYNDRCGHQAGDRLLREAAASWRGVLRPYDILARYGGEEFSVILPGCSLDAALALVERLRATTPEGESCSAGVAEWDGDEQAESLVGRADAALYRAKGAGRDRAVASQSS